jgi:SAM-dependent methyltransferase
VLKQTIGFLHSTVIFPRRVRVIADAIQDLMPEGAHILDVGSGDGSIAKALWDGPRNLTIHAIDAIERPETKFKVQRVDGQLLPFENGAFDIVSFVDVLHHTADPRTLLREAARVARQFVIIKDHFAENGLDHAILRFMDWAGNAPYKVALPYNYMSRTSWDHLWRDSGLEIETMRGRLELYPFPLSSVCGRDLHFIARLAVKPDTNIVSPEIELRAEQP